jgi:hypothetical protein
MSESDSPSHWDSIADEIGVTPRPELPRPEPTPLPPDTGRQTKSRTVQDKAPATAPPPASDWNSLAADLGVAPAPPSERPAQPAATRSRRQVDKAPERKPEETAVPEQAATVAADDLAQTADIDAPEGGPVTASFEAVEEQVDFGEAEPQAKSKEDEEEGGDRRLRRRRPRRRSTKKRAAETGEAAVKDQAATTTDAKPAAEKPAEDQPAATEPAVEQLTAAADDEQPKGEPATSRPTRPSHRNIPPWEEAVSVIVDANIEARASRTKAGRSRSRGGRGRGRKH